MIPKTDFVQFVRDRLLVGPWAKQPDLNPAQINNYYTLLKDLDLPLLHAALTSYQSKSQWFPMPAQLRQEALLLVFDTLPEWYAGWQSLLNARAYLLSIPPTDRKEPHFANPLVGSALAALGGYPILLNTDDDKLPFLQNRFREVYGTEIGRFKRMVSAPEDVKQLTASPHYRNAVKLLGGGE